MPKDLLSPQNQPKDLLAAPAAPPAPDVSREKIPNWRQQVMAQHEGTMAGIRNPDWRGMTQRADDFVRGAAEGATLGFADEIAAAADTLSGLGEGTYEQNLAAQRERDLQSDPAARLAGNVGGAVATGRFLPTPSTVTRAAGMGAGLGGTAGFGSGEGGFQQRLEDAGYGALFGGAAGGALSALGRVISPRSSPAVQSLMDEGVTPTPGQALGPRMAATEEKLISAPIMGGAIRDARQRALDSFNRSVINKALSPAGMSVADDIPAGRAAFNAADDMLSNAYDDVVGRVGNIRFDRAFANELNQALGQARADLTEDGFNIFRRQVGKVFNPTTMSKGSVEGKDLHSFISDLKKQAKGYYSSSTQAERNIGNSLRDLNTIFDDLLQRNMSPDDASTLQGLRRAYAQFMPVEAATARVVSADGIFTPEALRSAVRQVDSSLRKRQFAKGNALMQDMAEEGVDVIGRQVPDSGTAQRVMTAGAMTGGAMLDPTVLGSLGVLGAASLPYRSPLVQNLLLQSIAGRQGPAFRAAGQATQSMAPAASMVAPAVATSLLGP